MKCTFDDYLNAQTAKCPPLSNVSKLSPRVWRILGGNPGKFSLQGTNTFLVGSGRERLLIDTGEGRELWITNLTNVLESNGWTISAVLLTHWHKDHTGGIKQIIAHQPDLISKIFKNQPDRGQRPIEDKQIFKVEGATIRAVFSPGHAFDHMCFVLEEENALFTGDNVLGHGDSVVVEDLSLYIRSLHTMEEQRCSIGYPAHGERIEDVCARIKRYIRHKETREQRVLRALRGCLTLREVANAFLGPIAQATLDEAIEACIMQVLLKLAEDGKVGFCLTGQERRWFAANRKAPLQRAVTYP